MFENRWATLAVLCLSLLVIVVDTTIVNVALPTLARELQTGPSGLAWVVDAYALVFAAMLLPAGSLGDRYGRDRALAFGLAVFAAGSLGAAVGLGRRAHRHEGTDGRRRRFHHAGDAVCPHLGLHATR